MLLKILLKCQCQRQRTPTHANARQRVLQIMLNDAKYGDVCRILSSFDGSLFGVIWTYLERIPFGSQLDSRIGIAGLTDWICEDWICEPW
jgi:hypothetical protein